MIFLRKQLFLILILFAFSANALEINPTIDSITLYTTTAFVTKSETISSELGETAVRIIIPKEADTDTLLIIDNGATIRQISFGETTPQQSKGILLQMVEGNLGQDVLLLTSLFNIKGKIKEVIREQYLVIENPELVDSEINIARNQGLFVPINLIESMGFINMPEIATEEQVRQKYADVLENAFSQSREIITQYFVSGASWQPVYHYFLESESEGKMQYWSKAKNETEEDWENVSISVVAGQPNLKPTYRYYEPRYYTYEEEMAVGAPAAESGQYTSSEVTEYHVYELQRKISIEKNSEVLIPLLSETIEYEKEYLWNSRNESMVRYNIKLVNTTLEPFAAGWVSVFKQGMYVGGDYINWTAKDANASLYLAPALDIEVKKTEDVRTEKTYSRRTDYYTIKLHLENHKSSAVTVRVFDYLRSDAEDFSANISPDKMEENAIEWNIPLNAGEEKDIIYSYNTKYYY